MEGLSGSAFSDILRGDNVDAVTIVNHGGATGGALTDVALINGLQELLGAGVTGFATGNIILGGDGSDIIEGRGGDDLIDGDKWLNVRISVRAKPDGPAPEIASIDSMRTMVPLMLDRDLQSRPARRGARDPDGDRRLRHRHILRQRADYTININDSGTRSTSATTSSR